MSTRSSARRRRSMPSPGSARSLTLVSWPARQLHRQALLDDFPDQGSVLSHDPIRFAAGRRDRRGSRPNRTAAGQPSPTSTTPTARPSSTRSEPRCDRRGHRPRTPSVPVLCRQRVDQRSRPVKVSSGSPGVVVVIGDAISGQVMLATIDDSAGASKPQLRRQRRDASAVHLRRTDGYLVGRADHRASRRSRTAPTHCSSPTSATPPTTRVRTPPTLSTASTSSHSRRLRAESTQPAAIADQIPAVSASGSPCMTFVASVETISTQAATSTTTGRAGTLTLGANGDLSEADFELFGFDETGRDYRIDTGRRADLDQRRPSAPRPA